MRVFSASIPAVAGLLVAAMATPALAAGATKRVSLGRGGVQAEGGASFGESISANGRFVAFLSNATNLVPGDTNGLDDVFVRDRQTGRVARANVRSNGAQANSRSGSAAISANGRLVIFDSLASNLVAGDTNRAFDVFVRDWRGGKTERVSIASDGAQGDSSSFDPATSADGRFVAFPSQAPNLVPGDTNGLDDVFVRDRQAGTTELVSVGAGGAPANGSSGDFGRVAISADGRFVAFDLSASNLVPGDKNGRYDLFVRDRQTGTTVRASVRSDGSEANGASGVSALSRTGRFVAFVSDSTNLVPGDTNAADDVFVHDLKTGKTTRVSVASGGAQAAEGALDEVSISGDGRLVAFASRSDDLVARDGNRNNDVFVHDRQQGTTR